MSGRKFLGHKFKLSEKFLVSWSSYYSPDIILSVLLKNIGSILNLGKGEFQNVMCHELG